MKKRTPTNPNVRTPIYLIVVSVIALALAALAIFGDLDASMMITIIIIGLIAIFVIMSIHDTNKYMEPENEGYPKIEVDPLVAKEMLDKYSHKEVVTEVDEKTIQEMKIQKKKEDLCGNLERPEPPPTPQPKAHVESHTPKSVESPPTDKFAPVAHKIPATSRQLYGDIYSFCDQLPLKTTKEIEAKLNSWGRTYSIVALHGEGTYILVAGAGSHYSVRIPQFGYFKTTAE